MSQFGALLARKSNSHAPGACCTTQPDTLRAFNPDCASAPRRPAARLTAQVRVRFCRRRYLSIDLLLSLPSGLCPACTTTRSVVLAAVAGSRAIRLSPMSRRRGRMSTGKGTRTLATCAYTVEMTLIVLYSHLWPSECRRTKIVGLKSSEAEEKLAKTSHVHLLSDPFSYYLDSMNYCRRFIGAGRTRGRCLYISKMEYLSARHA